ncbi:MAG: hypothetical protein GC171_11650 [Terrimonas sp.]|nr:hypothetical protein [Terrimonas sp.]
MKKRNAAIGGAAFLMATSAIGPGFLTQTSVFTEALLTNFGFVILISVVIDICVQLNIWRVITMSGFAAQDLANQLLPGLGVLLAFLIAAGGLVFNIGNIGGTGLGLEVLTGMDTRYGALISCLIALGVFGYRKAGSLMDIFTRVLGLLMILLTLYIAFSAHPPIGEAVYRSFWPATTDTLKIVTLVGGTVGGYISFAGAHRLLEAGIKGKENRQQVSASAVRGILLTSLMRFVLFLAVLGVVWQGVHLDPANPLASAFRMAAGKMGYLFFGVVMWSAAITSVVGASYTSISFWKTLHPYIAQHERWMVSGFIIASTVLFLVNPHPVKLLIFAGAANGFILPLSLVVILIIATKKRLLNGYHHPVWMQVLGWLVVLAMSWMSVLAVRDSFFK